MRAVSQVPIFAHSGYTMMSSDRMSETRKPQTDVVVLPFLHPVAIWGHCDNTHPKSMNPLPTHTTTFKL